MSEQNLIENPQFRESDLTEPKGWRAVCPNSSLSPEFGWRSGEISVGGRGNPYVFGYWSQRIPINYGGSYCLRVRFRVSGITDVNLHVLNMVLWHRDGYPMRECPYDHISSFRNNGDFIEGEDIFSVPDDVVAAEIQLGLRFAAHGVVCWDEVELFETTQRKRRKARFSALAWHAPKGASVDGNITALASWLDKAGALRSDLVLLPEYASQNGISGSVAEVAESIPDGPTSSMLSAKALEHGMYVCAGVVERERDMVFNTAVLFDRTGHLVGKYRKVHLYWPELAFDGIVPGEGFPVFSLDIGDVGVLICYDSWFAESARLLGLKGSEVILLPNAGYSPLILPARAIDNRCHIVVSSLYGSAMIINTLGETVAEATTGLISSELELSFRPTPHSNAGGSLNSSPGGRRSLRNALSHQVYREILNEVSTWENRPDEFDWLRTDYIKPDSDRSGSCV